MPWKQVVFAGATDVRCRCFIYDGRNSWLLVLECRDTILFIAKSHVEFLLSSQHSQLFPRCRVEAALSCM